MARRDANPDFIEALARGLDVIRVFRPRQPTMSLAAVAAASGLARPTARRILLTLQQMGYVRAADGGFEFTPRVLELGMAYVLSRGLWEIACHAAPRLDIAPGQPGPQGGSGDLVGQASGLRTERLARS
jgi:IclR family pca regulon transcriptional regulator